MVSHRAIKRLKPIAVLNGLERRRRTPISHLRIIISLLLTYTSSDPNSNTPSKISDQVLSIAPGDEDALRCKVVALTRADSFEKALSTIQSSQKFPTDI